MKDLLKVNLQLFAEDETHEDVVDSQDVDDLDYEDSSHDIDDDEEFDLDDDEELDDDIDSELDEEEEVVEPQEDDKQSPQENARYKKMRLKAEKEARAKIEAELAEDRKQIQAMKLTMEAQASEKKILDEYLNPQKIYDYAYENDMSEEQAKKMLRYEADKVIEAEKTKVHERFRQVQDSKRELQKDKYFRLLEKEVDKIVDGNPDLDYKAVYYYQRGLKSEELENKLAKNVERRTVANMHDRARRKSLGSSSSGNSSRGGSQMSSFGKEFASYMGVDPREASKVIKQRGRKKR